MCAPIAALAPVALQVGFGAYSAYNQLQQGKAEQNYYNSVAENRRRQGEIDLQVGQRQSEMIQDKAKAEGKQLKRSQAEFNASQQVALASQGITGVTADDIAASTIDKERLDELNLRYNADVASWETNTDATYRKYAADVEAQNYQYAGKMARSASKRNAFNTLLGTAASVAISPSISKIFQPKYGPYGGMQTSSGPISFLKKRV
jgi:hypothetical protein